MNKVEPKIIEHVRKILQSFDDKYMDGEKIKRNILINNLDKYDVDLMTALLSDDLIKKSYVEKVANIDIFKVNQFIEMLEYKEYLEDSYTKFANKIGLKTGGKFIDESTDVVLDFPFKDCVLKASMSREDADDTDEVFLNEVIAKSEIDELFDPKILVNTKKYDEEGEHEVTEFRDDDNLVIKGNNLIALHSIKKRYAGKVKLIYLDPPYNTGSDSFVYNDRFNHSAWLTFMKNRLEIARDLLSEDGIIVTSIYIEEFAELKLLLDSIFNKENYLGTVINVSTPNGRDYGMLAQTHDYLHFYGKNISLVKYFKIKSDEKKFNKIDKFGKYYLHPLANSNKKYTSDNRPNLYYPFYVSTIPNDEGYYDLSTTPDQIHNIEIYPPKHKNGTQQVWRWGKEGKLKELINVDLVGDRKKDGSFRIVQKMRPNDTIPRSIWEETELSNRKGTSELEELFQREVFSFPKPESLLKKIIDITTNENDLVLDFFMGSATTQAVAMKMNRRFIGIEQMDYINEVSVPRLQKVIAGEQGGISKDVNWQGGGSFVYAELMEKNTGYLKEIVNAKEDRELEKIFDRMKEFGDLDFRVDLEKFAEEKSQLSFDGRKEMLMKIIDKNQLYYNYSEIDDENVRELLTNEDYEFNNSFYGGIE